VVIEVSVHDVILIKRFLRKLVELLIEISSLTFLVSLVSEHCSKMAGDATLFRRGRSATLARLRVRGSPVEGMLHGMHENRDMVMSSCFLPPGGLGSRVLMVGPLLGFLLFEEGVKAPVEVLGFILSMRELVLRMGGMLANLFTVFASLVLGCLPISPLLGLTGMVLGLVHPEAHQSGLGDPVHTLLIPEEFGDRLVDVHDPGGVRRHVPATTIVQEARRRLFILEEALESLGRICGAIHDRSRVGGTSS
jgi:hypothetical protein